CHHRGGSAVGRDCGPLGPCPPVHGWRTYGPRPVVHKAAGNGEVCPMNMLDSSPTPIDAAADKRSSRGPGLVEVDRVVDEAATGLKGLQNSAGDWCFELEADVTIPAEYIFLEHFTNEIDEGVERKLAAYLRATQADHGGWPLFFGGELNISASVKAYYALKLVGDDPDAPHIARARAAILAHCGASPSDGFTRFALAH